jgi:arginyl-tRNA synthetase
MTVANLFHTYYDKYRCITDDKELSKSRLVLIKTIKTVLHNGLELLGISAPERM